MTERDFEDEQRYYIEKRKLHNQLLHGWGVVCGLILSLRNKSVQISPGFALDFFGNEIIVPENVEINLPDKVRFLYIVLRYAEFETDPVQALPESSPSDETQKYSRIKEGFKLACESEIHWKKSKCK